ncbi:MAG: hypothetical protein WDN45_15770 [Caulobacteraceae bacterium]
MAALLAPLGAAHAAAVIKFGDESSISVGMGIRASESEDDHGSATGGSSTAGSPRQRPPLCERSAEQDHRGHLQHRTGR